MKDLDFAASLIMSKELKKDYPSVYVLSLALSQREYITDFEREAIDKSFEEYDNMYMSDYPTLNFENFQKINTKRREEFLKLLTVCHNTALNREISSYRNRPSFERMKEICNTYRV